MASDQHVNNESLAYRSFSERVSLKGDGTFEAHHSDYRHKRSQKSPANLKRLAGAFKLPSHMQKKLRKAGFK
jgi:ribosomal protein L35